MPDGDPIREGIQKVLDTEGDGWTVAHYAVAVGLERVTSDGQIETSPWCMAQKWQPEYVTDGLLNAIEQMRAEVTED